MMKKDDRLIENIRQVLDRSLDDLDAATRSKLTQARHLALERRQRRKSRLLYWGSVPAAGLVLLVLLLNWQASPIVPVAAPEFGELSILTAVEPLEFYQEEIEFYEWLSEVLETESGLSGRPTPQFIPAVADRISSSGDQCAGTAEPGTARLSGVI